MSVGRKRALVVVLEQQRVGIGQRIAGDADQPVEVGAVEQRLDLVVDPDDLLRAGDDAGLGRGRPAGHRDHEPVVEPRDRELLPDRGAVGVVPHDADQETASRRARRRSPRRWPRRRARACRSRTVTTGTGASGLSRSVSPTR